jgi:hypothetical protein
MPEFVSSSVEGDQFSILQSFELAQALPSFCLEIRRAAALLRKNKQTEDQQILNRISPLILQKAAPESWDASIADPFLYLALTVLQQQLGRIDQNDQAGVANLRRQVDIACSLVAKLPQVAEATRLRISGLWTRLLLLTGLLPQEPEDWLARLVDGMSVLGLDEEALRNQTKAQYVMRASKLVYDGSLLESADVARTWCRDLLALPEFRGLLKPAASTLKVEVPAADDEVAPAIQPPIAQAPSTTSSGMLQVPDSLSEPAASELRNTILFQLYAQSGVPDSPLSEQTKRQVNELLPETPAEQMNTTFYYAGVDLWKGYWTSGNAELLEIVRPIARHLFAAGASEAPPKERDKSNAVQLWIAAQLPEFLLTCEIKQLVEAVNQLCRHIKARVNDFAVKQTIIEAFAGHCRRLQAEGQTDERAELLKEYGPDLRMIHGEYDSKTSAMSTKPWIIKLRQDEQAAWDYLFPSALPPQPVAVKDSPDGQVDQSPPPTRDKVLDEHNFRTVVRGGDHHEIFGYITRHLADIEDLLRRRLNVKLTPANIMEPEGTIREGYGTKERQENAQFREGREALERGNFLAASKVFKRLADRMDGTARQIANSYLAYAEVKQGDTLEGRRLLNMVCESRITFSSPYWNLACCLPSTDTGQQLETIARGLEISPHPRLLDAAIYLGVFLRDDRLRVWLPCETKTEALLLFYHLVFEETEGAERERHLMQLAAYLRNGEPSGPDPTRSNLQRNVVWSYVTALSDAQRPEVIEFWLRCREVSHARRYDFWEIKADYYDKTNRSTEAALAFKEELTCRLSLLRSTIKRPKDNRDRDFLSHGRIVRQRSWRWLNQCMSDKLRPTGVSIYNTLKAFDDWYQKVREAQGLPEIQFLGPAGVGAAADTAYRRVTEFYRPEEDIEDDAPQPNTASGAQMPLRKSNTDPAGPKPNLSEILTQVGAACQKDLHEASGLVIVRPAIDSLAKALKDGSGTLSAGALQILVAEWESYAQHATEHDKRAALDRANAGLADLKAKLSKDLSQQEFVLTTPLLNALRRVNERLVRDLQLLPEIVIEPVQGNQAQVDLDAPKTALAVRVRSLAADRSSSIVLVNAHGILDDGTELRVRDDLSLLPTPIKPGESAVLTFSLDSPSALPDRGKLRIELVYNCLGTDIHAPSTALEFARQSCPDLPERSPYISMRMIEPDEIAEHFFGRDVEQRDILASVSNGQEKIRYVEGIRRSGKSSLLNSIVYRIGQENLPLIPVYWSIAEASGVANAGVVLHNLFVTICRDHSVSSAGIVPPDQQRCISNPSEAYSEFEAALAAQLPDKRVLALVDDFQELIKAAAEKREKNDPAFSQGVMAILNLIRARATTKARLLWLFSGQNAARRYRDKDMLPGCLLWANWRTLPIDFLDVDAVRSIVTGPLKNTGIVVPMETISRIHFLTSGHPEAIQQIAEMMLNRAREERRWVLTPSDVDTAGQQLAKENDDTFADTWFPTTELTDQQQSLVASLVNAIPVGGRIELFKLAANNQVTEDLRNAQDDLIARKILSVKEDDTIGVRAPVLDFWLHRHWIQRVHASGAFNGNAAIFIDVANLTGGWGAADLTRHQPR